MDKRLGVPRSNFTSLHSLTCNTLEKGINPFQDEQQDKLVSLQPWLATGQEKEKFGGRERKAVNNSVLSRIIWHPLWSVFSKNKSRKLRFVVVQDKLLRPTNLKDSFTCLPKLNPGRTSNCLRIATLYKFNKSVKNNASLSYTLSILWTCLIHFLSVRVRFVPSKCSQLFLYLSQINEVFVAVQINLYVVPYQMLLAIL